MTPALVPIRAGAGGRSAALPVDPKIYEKRSIWTTIFGTWWFNRRQTPNIYLEEEVLIDSWVGNGQDEGEIHDDLDHVLVKTNGEFTLGEMNELRSSGCELLKGSYVQQLNEDGTITHKWRVDYRKPLPVEHKNGETWKCIRRGKKKSYENKLLFLIREKFPFMLTPRTSLNYKCIHRYATQLMIEHNVRLCDRVALLATVVERYFIPCELDKRESAYRNTVSAQVLREDYNRSRTVEHSFQRFVGLGLLPHVGGLSSQ